MFEITVVEPADADESFDPAGDPVLAVEAFAEACPFGRTDKPEQPDKRTTMQPASSKLTLSFMTC